MAPLTTRLSRYLTLRSASNPRLQKSKISNPIPHKKDEETQHLLSPAPTPPTTASPPPPPPKKTHTRLLSDADLHTLEQENMRLARHTYNNSSSSSSSSSSNATTPSADTPLLINNDFDIDLDNEIDEIITSYASTPPARPADFLGPACAGGSSAGWSLPASPRPLGKERARGRGGRGYALL